MRSSGMIVVLSSGGAAGRNELERKAGDPAEDGARMQRQRRVVDAAEALGPREQHAERDLGLRRGERGAETVVRPEAEGEVPSGLPRDVEDVGTLEDLHVAVGRS